MKTSWTRSFATFAITCASACAFTQTSASAAPASLVPVVEAPAHSGRRLDGLWDEHITLVNCSSGAPIATFRATNLFGSDGSLVAVNSNTPALQGTTLGTWWRASRHGDFGAKMRFFRFNPDGTFAGVQQVTRAIQVDPDGDTLTGTVSVEIFDVNDNLLQTACAREEGTRLS